MAAGGAGDRKAFSFGANVDGLSAQGATPGDTLVATPIDDSLLAGASIVKVGGGVHQGVAVSADGDPFTFGRNDDGITGLGLTSGATLVATPTLPGSLGTRAVIACEADLHQTLLLTDDGLVFACGWNNHGSTGQGTRLGSVTAPTQIAWTNLQGRTITDIAAGGLHSLVLADNGRVYSFGSNWEGQTGLGVGSSWTVTATAINTSFIGSRSIVRMSAGWNHSLVLADDGVVFSFGANANGRTGRNTTSGFTGVATPINTQNLGGRSIVEVAAGGFFSLILADDGSVFSFGGNTSGVTGLGSTSGDTLIATPVDLTALGARRVSKISAGSYHSLLLTEDGVVFSFGANANGRTGLGIDTGVTTIAAPIDTSNLDGYRVVQISAAGAVSLLVAEEIPAAPGPTVYCTAGTSTNGCSASISANVQPNASSDAGCLIAVTGVEGMKQGLVFYGVDNSGFAPMPWGPGGTSYSCVKAPTQRTGSQSAGGTLNACDGAFALDWDAYQASHPWSLGSPLTAGDKIYAQVGDRDPPSPKTTNLSNALELTVQPPGGPACAPAVGFFSNCATKEYCFSGQVRDDRLPGSPPATFNVDARITWVDERWAAAGNCPVVAFCTTEFFDQPPCVPLMCATVPPACDSSGAPGLCGELNAPILALLIEFYVAGHLGDPAYRVFVWIHSKVDNDCQPCCCPGNC